ncbi:MAG: ribosome maturation factor RimM [Synergistaceae bacterium]|jgi:16S rRNA processing protein RimM|nr:ribosome maturation factor RimM [Synergistaceae bacterium]
MSTSPDIGKSGKRRVQIGYIAGAHGMEGVLRVVPTTDYPERFFDMETLVAEQAGKPPLSLKITGVKHHSGKGQILISAEGVDGRDAAEALKGRKITISPEERVELPEGEYWIDSLIGLEVIDDESGVHLGSIEEIMNTGNNDVYRIRTDDGALKLIPAIRDVIRDISLEHGTVRVKLLEGLWD